MSSLTVRLRPDMAEESLERKLVYDEAMRALALQPVLLNELRSRSGILFGVANVATAFLGGQALEGGRSFSWWSWGAIVAFVGTALLTISVLWPRSDWVFQMGTRSLLEGYVDDYQQHGDPADIDEMRADVALHAEQHFDANQKRLNGMYLLFEFAAMTLVVEIVLWLADLGQR